MKKIITRISLAAASILSICSCADFLNTKPYDFVAPETFYTTESNCKMALAGVYSALNQVGTYGNMYSILISGSDDMAFYTRKATTTAANVYGNDHTPANSNVWEAWTEFYTGINNANIFLEKIDGSNLSDELKKQYKGEAKFLRAYYHWILFQGWHSVPLRKESFKDVNNSSMEATSHAEGLKWIIKEMEECVDMVDDSAYDKSPSYVKKTTVMGILARVYLWSAGYPNNGGKDDYKKAAYWANKVKESGKHQLNPDFESIWKNICSDKYDPVYNESMWEVEFLGSRDDGINTMSRIGNTIGNLNGGATSYSYGFYAGTLLLWDLYSADDQRRDVTMSTYQVKADGSYSYWTSSQIIKRSCGKFRREWEPASSTNKNWTPENWPLLRYSDVLLMLAEAENEANEAPTALAYECINAVRARGSMAPLEGLTYDQFQQEVRDERARELSFEGLRKYDLIRWGIYVSRIKNELAAAVKDKRWKNGTVITNNDGGVSAFISRTSEKHQFLPIPEKELGVNLLLEQNSYWKSGEAEDTEAAE